MGRLFDTKETSTSTTKGRLFTEPVAKQPSTLSKVGEFVKPIAQDLYSTAATIPVRAVQAEELLRTQAFGSNESKKKAMEFASKPVNIGLGTTVKPLDTSSVGRAAQQTAGDILKTASLTNIGGKLTLAKQAALQGATYGLGNAMSEGKSVGETVKETALGAGLGLAGGKVISVLKDAKIARQLAKKTDEQLFNEASTRANLGPIPEASKPRLSLPSPRTPNEIPIELPSPGILESQAKLREGYTPATLPVEQTKKAKVSSKVSKTPVAPEVVKPITPKPVSYTKDPIQSLTKTMETELPPNADPTFINTTLANQTAKYDSVASVTPTDDLIDMAMGIKPIPEGLSPVSIHALTSIRNDLTVEQAMRLKNIYPLSQAGQELSLAKLKSGAVIDNPIDMMQTVEKELKDKLVQKGISKNDIKNLFPDCGFN